jgi:hypothetical protein
LKSHYCFVCALRRFQCRLIRFRRRIYHENEKATADFSVFTNGNYLNRNGAVLQQQIDFTSALPQ